MRKNKKVLNRKGVFSHVQLAILAIMAIIVFSLFLYKSYTKMSDKMAVQDCKNSIAAHSIVNKGSFGEIFTDIKCPTREITIKKLKKTNEIVAEEMHRCWYVWGQGQGQYFKGDGNFCHICAVYQFSEKGKEVKGLNEYLLRTDVPVRFAGESPGVKYIDYFQGYSTPNTGRKLDEKIQVPVELDTINTSERYVTVFVYASGKDAITKMLEGGKRTTATTGLAMFGLAGGAGSFGAAGAAAAASTAATTIETVQILATAEFVTEYTVVTTVAATTGTVLSITPVGWVIIGAGILILTGAGIYLLLDNPDPEWAAYVAFRPYNADELKALSCDQMVVNQMSNTGR